MTVLLSLLGCLVNGALHDSLADALTDDDGDGFPEKGADCDDHDARVGHGLAEICDGLDNDCDGVVDDDPVDQRWYTDVDRDGYGDDATALATCVPPAGRVAVGGDCDDGVYDVSPAASEVCNGSDDDCDGDVDEADATDAGTWHPDDDRDGYGRAAETTTACAAPEGWVADGSDCDDTRGDVHPGAAEVCDDADVDEDCDGVADNGDADATGRLTWYVDEDADGYGTAQTTLSCEHPFGYAEVAGDCDDARADVHPGAAEVCNDVDDDCDETVDGAGAVDRSPWYPDEDADGYGDDAGVVFACDAPDGAIALGGDCDDARADVSPDGHEVCDASDVDEDCDGVADNGDTDATGRSTWYLDGDGDGDGDPTAWTDTCDRPYGYSANATDCDDSDAAVYPEADERCNDVDDDCDGAIDGLDSVDVVTWFADADADGWGADAYVFVACDGPSGWVDQAGDCDDGRAEVNPGAVEICDTSDRDEDCDGVADNGDTDAVGRTTFYLDADLDGYGVPTSTTSVCDRPHGYAEFATDCDDAHAEAHPGGEERCDGLDDDCDGTTDEAEAVDAVDWYADGDGDGYGRDDDLVRGCAAEPGRAAQGGDCDDGDAAVNPGVAEVCDPADVDEDCDGLADDADGNVEGATSIWPDDDADGWGAEGAELDACDLPPGWVARGEDCDDADGAVSPGAEEICHDGVDNDCDGTSNACSFTGSYLVDDADVILLGEAAGDGLGRYVGAPCDYTGDGVDDLIVSSWGVSHDGTTNGAVYVFEDSSGYTDLGAATVVVGVSKSGSHFGGRPACIPGAADDGTARLWIAASHDSSYGAESGAVYEFQAAMTGARSTADALHTIFGEVAGDRVGTSVSSAVDDDGDGFMEVLLGSKGFKTTGAVSMVDGASSGYDLFSDADVVVYGEVSGDAFSITADGRDLDGDGVADYLLAAPNYDGTAVNVGRAYVFPGPIADYSSAKDAPITLTGRDSGATLGLGIDTANDVDGDGYSDVVVGVPYSINDGTASGEVCILNGPLDGSRAIEQVDADTRILGTTAGVPVGSSVRASGDVDANGLSDLVIGTCDSDDCRGGAGAAYLALAPIRGLGGISDFATTFVGHSGSSLGRGVGVVGDLDGDSYDDVVVGAQYDDSAFADGGALYVFYGSGI